MRTIRQNQLLRANKAAAAANPNENIDSIKPFKTEEELNLWGNSLSLLKDYKSTDYLLLTGDPAIIGVACSIVSDITNGKYKLLKWDKQERRYYPIEIDLYQKSELVT